MTTFDRRRFLGVSAAAVTGALTAGGFGTAAFARSDPPEAVTEASLRDKLSALGADITDPDIRHQLIPPNDSRTAIVVARPRARDEAARQLRALSGSDLQPTGQYLPAGALIQLDVNAVDDKLPTLVVGAPASHADEEYDEPRGYELTGGYNEITDPGGGMAYLSLAGDGELAIVKFTLGSRPAPWLRLGADTTEDFQAMLDDRPDSPQVELVGPRATVTVSREAALIYRDADQSTVAELLERIVASHAATSGMDGSAAIHDRPLSSFHLIESPRMPPGAGAYATHGFTAYPRGYLDRLLDPSGLHDRGWGVWHELGHQHQQSPYKPSATTEVTVNIYSLAIQRELGLESNLVKPDDAGLTPYDLSFAKLGADGLDFLADFTVTEMLVQCQQLTLAYGEQFWPRVHQLVRTEQPDGGSWDDNALRFHHLMTYTSRVAGEDLRGFYTRWGMTIDPRTDTELDSRTLPQPEVDPSTLREG